MSNLFPRGLELASDLVTNKKLNVYAVDFQGVEGEMNFNELVHRRSVQVEKTRGKDNLSLVTITFNDCHLDKFIEIRITEN